MDHLLNSGAEPNAEDVRRKNKVYDKYIMSETIFRLLQKSNWTSLVLASRNGHLGVVKRLLNGGADPNKTKEVTCFF